MKVTATDLQQVRFPEGKRGYDSEKVDAVLAEVAATLKEYEQAEEALHRTFIEAQRIKDEMTSEAGVEAAKVRTDADGYSSKTRAQADDYVSQSKAKGQEALVTAQSQSDAQLQKAQEETKALRAEASKASGEARAQAESDADQIRAEAKGAGEKLTAEAAHDAGKRVADAKKKASEMLREAKAEHEVLSRKVPQLRTAVSDIEKHLKKLAETGIAEVEVAHGMIDLAEEEAIDEAVTAASAAPEAPAAVEAVPEPVAAIAPETAAEPEATAPRAAANSIPDSRSLRAPSGVPTDAPVEDDEKKESFYGSGLRRRMGGRTKN